MAKFLIQFYIEVKQDCPDVPTLLPTKGVLADTSRKLMTELIEHSFEKFPEFKSAAISKLVETDNTYFVTFDSYILNKDWNGMVAEGTTFSMNRNIYEMMG